MDNSDIEDCVNQKADNFSGVVCKYHILLFYFTILLTSTNLRYKNTNNIICIVNRAQNNDIQALSWPARDAKFTAKVGNVTF